MGGFKLTGLGAGATAGDSVCYEQVMLLDGTQAMSGALQAFGGGVRFPAVQVPSANANTLDDYEEGSWTPADASGAGLSFTGAEGQYTRIGRQVTVIFALVYPATVSTSSSSIGGLPFAAISNQVVGSIWPYGLGSVVVGAVTAASSTITPYNITANANLTNAQLASRLVRGVLTYFI